MPLFIWHLSLTKRLTDSLLRAVELAKIQLLSRQVIRLTWGSPEELAVANATLVFVLAHLGNQRLQDMVEEEASRYGDLLQGDFEEHYHRLAYKSMCAFSWAQAICAAVPWFMKTDDDTVHNMLALDREVGFMKGGNPAGNDRLGNINNLNNIFSSSNLIKITITS